MERVCGGETGRRWDKQREKIRDGEREKARKNTRKLFTLANQTTSFKQVKGFIPSGENTFEFCQHLSTTQFEKNPIFLGLQRRLGLLTTAGNRRCGIRILEGVGKTFHFFPMASCHSSKAEFEPLFHWQIRLLEGIILLELFLFLYFFYICFLLYAIRWHM